MSPPKMRPIFEIELATDPESAAVTLKRHLASPDAALEGVASGHYAELTLPEAERHRWSPCLSVTLEERAGRTLLHGRFGPHPHIWTFFMFLHGGLLFIATVAIVWGLSQWLLAMTPWALLLVPLCLASHGGLYAASLFGQRLGAQEMLRLRETLESWLHPSDEGQQETDPAHHTAEERTGTL